jgi:hypothetical protein
MRNRPISGRCPSSIIAAAAALANDNLIQATIALDTNSDDSTIARAAKRLTQRLPDPAPQPTPDDQKPEAAPAPSDDP